MLKKSLASFLLTLLSAGLLLPALTRTADATPPEGTDDYPDSVIMEHSTFHIMSDATAKATDSDFDFFWDEPEMYYYYIGYETPFHSFTVEIKSSGSISGGYELEYWDGSTWSTLSSSVSEDSDSYKVSWDEPSNWAKTSLSDSQITTRTLYFVKYTLLDDRNFDKEASQIGVNLSEEDDDEEPPAPTPDDDDDDDDDSNEPNLTVTDLQVEDDEDLVVDMKNNGDDDADRDVQYTIYVDGDKELEDEFDENYFEEDNTLTWTFNGFFDQQEDDEDYRIEFCLDEDDDIDEESESDNCRTETFTIDGTGDNSDDDDDSNDSDLPDLYVDDIRLSSDDEVEFTLGNKGDDDVDSNDDVTVKVYVDGDKVWSEDYDQDSNDDFLDEDEKDTINAGELLEDEDETYEVEVCVDTSDNVDEEKESNNCETEDLRIDDNDDDVELNSDCDAFYDTDGHWAEDYICNLYERGVVEGRLEDRYYYPDSYVTRAEFAKMVLLSAEENVDEDSSYDDYSDVSSSKWYYSYITFGTKIGMLTGYEGTPYFKPDNSINRGEAVAMLMRMEEDVDGRVDDNDIPFWDVDDRDWFAGAIVAASDYDFIDGYSDGSFRPENAITRGEAAKIVDLAYDEFYR